MKLEAAWGAIGRWDGVVFVVGFAALVVIAYLLARDEPLPVPVSLRSQGAEIARLEEARNVVQSRPAALPAWEEAVAGQKFRHQDNVFTSADSYAKVTFNDGTKLTVEENSLIVLEMETQSAELEIRRGLVYIVSGRSEADVVFRVNGVRGTVKAGSSEAVVNVRPGGSADVTVLSGMATLGNQEILARYSATVDKDGKVAEPVALTVVLKAPEWNADFYLGDGARVPFEWSLQRPVKDLRLEISQDSLFTTLVRNVEVDGTAATLSDLPVGQLYWRVTGVKTDGKQGERASSDARRVNFIAMVPPDVVKPAAGERIQYQLGRGKPKTIFDWVNPYGSNAVELEVVAVSESGTGGERTAAHQATLARPPYLLDSLPEGSFVFRLRSRYGNGGVSVWTAERAFQVAKAGPPPPPTVLEPVDGAKIGFDPQRRPDMLFAFSGAPEAAELLIEIARTQAFDGALEKLSAKALRKRWTPPDMTTYWWRAQVTDVFGQTSGYTEARRFAAVGAMLELQAPAAGASVQVKGAESPVVFRWSAVPGAYGYELEVSSEKNFAKSVRKFQTTAPEHAVSEWVTGDYFWRASVAMKEGDEPLRSEVRPLRVLVKPVLQPPTLPPREVLIEWGETEGSGWNWRRIFEETAYAQGGARARVTWPGVENAAKYRLQVSRDEAFQKIVLDQQTEGTAYLWTAPEVGGFFYRVQAIDAEGTASVFSNPAPLKVSYPALKLITPAIGAKVKAGATTSFRWKGAPGLDKYVIEIAKEKSFKNVVEKKETSGGAVDLTLADGGTYYWRVRSLTAGGQVAAQSGARALGVEAKVAPAPLPAPQIASSTPPPKVPPPRPKPPPSGRNFVALGGGSSTLDYSDKAQTFGRTISGTAQQGVTVDVQAWPGAVLALGANVRARILAIDGVPANRVNGGLDVGIRLGGAEGGLTVAPHVGYASWDFLTFARSEDSTDTAVKQQRASVALAGAKFFYLGRIWSASLDLAAGKPLLPSGWKATAPVAASATALLNWRFGDQWMVGLLGARDYWKLRELESEDGSEPAELGETTTYGGVTLGFLL